jgi:hypothetical protein
LPPAFAHRVSSPSREDELIEENLIRFTISNGDFPSALSLLNKYPAYNINSRDPLTGRTVLHDAASSNHEESLDFIYQLMREYHADIKIRDNAGYTAAELTTAFHTYDVSQADHLLAVEYKNKFFIGELNARLMWRTKACDQPIKNQRIELVNNTQDMAVFILKNIQYDQIAFLIKQPNSTTSLMSPEHAATILFDRDLNVFVQLDTFGMQFLIPEIPFARQICSRIERQASVIGCREDGILIAYEIFTKMPDFFNFCSIHAKKCETDSLKPLSQNEMEVLIALESRQGVIEESVRLNNPVEDFLTPEEKKICSALRARLIFLYQLQTFQIEGISPLTEIYDLFKWPVQLANFIERFDAMYGLRNEEELASPKHRQILEILLEQGGKRTPSLSPDELISNVHSPESAFDKRFDFAGKNFEKRHHEWESYRHNVSQSRYRLFSTKLSSFTNDAFHLNLTAEKQRAAIAEKICDFAGLKR